MEIVTVKEMLDYVADCGLTGYRLTPSGLAAAEIILTRRADWTADHRKMLASVRTAPADAVFPHNFRRLVAETRLGEALELARKITRETRRNQKSKTRRNQKSKARRKAAKARRAAANRATALAVADAMMAA